MVVMVKFQDGKELGKFEHDEAMQLLREIGQQLDMDIFPLVKNGGLVVPDPAPTDKSTSVKEKQNERQGQRRPETGTRTGSERRQRQAYRSWTSCQTPPIISQCFARVYELQFEEIRSAYPSVRIWQQAEDLWLLTEISILPGHWHKAVLVIRIPYSFPYIAQSWGFWVSGLSPKPVWIGPRHTNFPDGSICAFEPSDRTWCVGQSIVELLDLYAVWVLRHRHLEIFGRWPGRQTAHQPFERMFELNPDEFCGCGSDKLYSDCCREKDLTLNRLTAALDFIQWTGGGKRVPPKAIVDFVCNRDDCRVLPPTIQPCS